MLKYFCFVFCLMMCSLATKAQVPTINQSFDTSRYSYDSHGNPIKKDSSNQELQHRDAYADSITISYRFWDSTRTHKVDSSINDFYSRYPVPWYYSDLGNFGTAAHSLLFQPLMQPGFDAGFHSFDIYTYSVENTKFYQTTRPYSELVFFIGSKREQMLELFHTQNRKSNFNIAFDFKTIKSPGSFRNQSTNNSNLRANTVFQSNNKRYNNSIIFISNKIIAAENGGLRADQNLDSLPFNDPGNANTKLGNQISLLYSRNPFNTTTTLGNVYKRYTILMRQSYDFGKKDSLVTDSVTYKLFYPRLRIQHTIDFSYDKYEYHDFLPQDTDYINNFNYYFGTGDDTIKFTDKWENLTNDFALISFPQKNNLNQFLKVNAGYEHIQGTFEVYSHTFNNIYVGGEYRNRTRNQLYDVEASGKLYVTGFYAGDYSANISFRRSLRKNVGSLQVGFENVNRTPSFIESAYIPTNLIDSGNGQLPPRQIPVRQSLTDFPVIQDGSFKKENITRIFADIDIPPASLQLTGEYYLYTNYTYFSNLYTATQSSTVFNVLHIAALKKIKVSKFFNWYLEGNLQQIAGNPPLNLPLVVARTRFAFEGNFFKNLFLSTGIEAWYNSPYKAPGYSPMNGQFYYQNTTTITNRPNINLYLNFRIKSFKGFVRLENLNALNPGNGFSFTKYNYLAPSYPSRTLWFRIGIWWNFVN